MTPISPAMQATVERLRSHLYRPSVHATSETQPAPTCNTPSTP